MAIASAPGYPQLSGLTIPKPVWSTKLLVKFYEATVLGAITNTDFEGEIKNLGDEITIRQTPTLTIRPYRKGETLVHETPEPDLITMVIDKAIYWNFVADDIDKYQSDYSFVEDWTEDASEQMKIYVDTDVLGTVYPDAAPENSGTNAGRRSGGINLGATGSPLALTKTNIIDFITDCGTVLDEQDVPENDRKLILPPWATALIKKSDLKDASLSGDGVSIARNGRVGVVDRFEIYNSNLLDTNDDGGSKAFEVMAMQRHAISFASQLTKNETLRAESTFGDLFRGLQVYGFKVLKPEALVHGHVIKG